MIGKTISHYRILEELGRGGMGVVYKAQDIKLDRLVALKFVPSYLASTEAEKKRFIHEAKAASALDHSNICTVHEIDETPDGQVFIVMGYYEGMPLNRKIEKSPLKIDVALDIATQVAEGLHAAHEKDIVHRDIKSSNIIVTEKEQVKIMDFGLARRAGATKITKTGATVGTVHYMSPEQARGGKIDQRTDIWSLGVVLYEMIAGRLPFESEYHEAVVYSILNEEPKGLTTLRSDVPMELERIVKKSMAKKEDERYQSIKDILVDLRLLQKTAQGMPVPIPKPKVLARKRWFVFGGIAGLTIAAVTAFLILIRTSPSSSIDSIAVLPLEDLSRDPEQEYFADGMTEALISDLAKIKALRVISRTSVMQYKKARKPLPEIARELNVSAVVEGTVLRSGQRVRITAQLIEAASDKHLWAETYERDLSDILGLQRELARAIVGEIKVRLTSQEEKHLSTTSSVNPKALEAYLKGRYYLEKWSYDGAKRAEQYFLQALAEDQNYALAYVGLAAAYSSIWGEGGIPGLSEDELRAKERAAVLKALELNEMLGEAHAALAELVFYTDWDFAGAEREYRRAIELNPSFGGAHHAYSHYLLAMGRFDESFVESKRYLELDPISPSPNLHLGFHYLTAGEYDHAVEQELRTLQMDPNYIEAHRQLGHAYLQKGMFDRAIQELQKAKELSGNGPRLRAYLAHGYAISGKRTEARQILNELLDRKGQSSRPVEIAWVYAGLGEKDLAFEWLQKAFEKRSGMLVTIKTDLEFYNLHGDPRFAALLKKIGLEK